MFDSNLVKAALGFYLFFAGIALFLLWRNSAAPDALKNAGILLASMLPILIAIFPYIKQEKLEKHFNFSLFYDSKEKTIITGDRFGPYDSNYIHMFANVSTLQDSLKAEDMSEVMEAKGLNIIEKGIIQAFLLKFMMHWDIEPRKFKGPIGHSESWSSNIETPHKTITIEEIRKIFNHNPLISSPGILVHKKLEVPPECTMRIENKNKFRTIIFEDPYTVLKIAFRASSAVVLQRGIWGVLKPDPQNANRFYAIEFKVSTALHLKKTKVYAPEVQKHRQWFENICAELAKYDWNVIDKEIEKSLTRKAISKILEIETP